MPDSSRMNPNPLSMRSRAIVPDGIPVSSDSKPLGRPEAAAPTDTQWYQTMRPMRGRRPEDRGGPENVGVSVGRSRMGSQVYGRPVPAVYHPSPIPETKLAHKRLGARAFTPIPGGAPPGLAP
jgi:hypothetical protein